MLVEFKFVTEQRLGFEGCLLIEEEMFESQISTAENDLPMHGCRDWLWQEACAGFCAQCEQGGFLMRVRRHRVSLGFPKPPTLCVVFDVQMRKAFLLPGAEVIRAEPAQSRESCAVLCWIDLSKEKLSQSVLPDMDVELDTTGKDWFGKAIHSWDFYWEFLSPKLFNVVEPSNILENQITCTVFRDPKWIYKPSLGTAPVCNFLPDTGTLSNIKESHCTFISLELGYLYTIGK